MKRNYEDGTYYVNVLDENGNTLDGAGGFRYRINALVKGADLLAKVATAEARGLPRGFVSMPEGPTPQPLFLRSPEQSAAPAADGNPLPADSTSLLDPTWQKGYDKEEIPNQERPENATEGAGDAVNSDADVIIRDGSQLENGKLKPNVTYQSGEYDYIYKTNEDGLITNAHTDSLQIKNHSGRLNHNPNTYGKVEGDQAGHLFGDRFGGSPELDNLVSQAKRVNQSEFKVLENHWASALKNRQQVAVDITINYANGGVRPVSFDVSYTLDGVPFFSSISN